MMGKLKIRLFTFADYEEEAQFLHDQHLKGLKYKKLIAPCFYVFEEAECEDVVYQLDYINFENNDHYFQLYRDYGWEHCGTSHGFNYFRKNADKINKESDREIFSDTKSKLDMISKLLRERILFLVSMFCLLIVQGIIINRHKDSLIYNVISGLIILLGIIYICIIMYCGIKLAKKKSELGK